jgi:hypothetical protein
MIRLVNILNTITLMKAGDNDTINEWVKRQRLKVLNISLMLTCGEKE